jgi:hypothetical protein
LELQSSFICQSAFKGSSDAQPLGLNSTDAAGLESSHLSGIILTNDNGRGQMVSANDDDKMTEVWVEEVDD